MKKFFNIFQITIVCVLIFSLTLAFVIIPDKTFSDKENRTLTQLPKLYMENLISGKYSLEIADYFADQFPFRDIFVSAKAYSELLLNKKENNDVIKCKDTLISKPENAEIRLKDNLNAISNLKNNCNVNTIVVALPRTIDVFSELLPKNYPKNNYKTIWNDFFSFTRELNISTVDVYSPLIKSNEYYRTDHHYTTHGAFTVYNLLSEPLGYTPKAKNYFETETVTTAFCGTSMRSSGYYLTKKDIIELYRYPTDNNYSIIADNSKIELYDFEKLKTTDSYSVFLGGNHARVDITYGSDREKLLIIRDSFADSIVPFLALHYDLTLIDLRYFSGNIQKIIINENFENVLIFESITEISTNKNLSYLNIPFTE